MSVKFIEVNSPFLINEVCDLAEVIWKEHYTPIIGQNQVDYMLNKFQSPKALTEQIANGAKCILIQSNGKNAGYFLYTLEDGLFLSKLYVHSDFRRSGIALNVIELLVDICQKQNLNRIWLTVNRNNSGSVEFYKKAGFKIAKEVRTDIGSGFIMDDYIMELLCE